ncbi:MAG: hypothetical protein WDA09_04345 [Bacteriovoracaceae bacterium]
MLVKKFEADTLEEALKAVKVELGPDAIILKTITNNGLKGAFKKKRIEITAAISEKNYEKKAKVDRVLNDDQKESFYQRPANSVKESIQKYASNDSAGGYGNIGLNKVVNTISKGSQSIAEVTSKTSSLLKSSFDDFLSTDDEEDILDEEETTPFVQVRPVPSAANRGRYAEPPQEVYREEKSNSVSREAYDELKQELKTQHYKIDLLEKKIQEMAQALQVNQKNLNEATGLYQLRTTLRTLDIDEAHVMDLIKKANYELSKEDLENPDIVFEFALKDMANSINTEMPLFASVEGNTITALFSESASGQSTMATKIALLKKDIVVVQYGQDEQEFNTSGFAFQVFDIKLHQAKSFAEVIGITRKAYEAKKSVLLDIRLSSRNLDETRKFIESLRRGFDRVEILCTISAIHSELYNRKILARYKDVVDGVIISHVDLCMSFGAIFNVHRAHNNLPLKFYGTGPVVPDDLEGATAERLMAGLFQF